VVYLGELPRLNGISFLQLRSICLQPLNFVSSLCEFSCKLVVVLGEEAVLLEEAIAFGFELISFAKFYLEECYFIK
jgi:hypothetical protein